MIDPSKLSDAVAKYNYTPRTYICDFKIRNFWHLKNEHLNWPWEGTQMYALFENHPKNSHFTTLHGKQAISKFWSFFDNKSALSISRTISFPGKREFPTINQINHFWWLLKILQSDLRVNTKVTFRKNKTHLKSQMLQLNYYFDWSIVPKVGGVNYKLGRLHSLNFEDMIS